ncbi:hypothetical protein E2C01_030622 [Portunus trituberculatus]|uniref:Uncharacterized protein n=1 Tax=Portunus trituberculatus TaxID=210409 RepID=A0A5B7EVR6_PORTR|nr:hypothetical protein [Portunus trituberculatus]
MECGWESGMEVVCVEWSSWKGLREVVGHYSLPETPPPPPPPPPPAPSLGGQNRVASTSPRVAPHSLASQDQRLDLGCGRLQAGGFKTSLCCLLESLSRVLADEFQVLGGCVLKGKEGRRRFS